MERVPCWQAILGVLLVILFVLFIIYCIGSVTRKTRSQKAHDLMPGGNSCCGAILFIMLLAIILPVTIIVMFSQLGG